MPVCKRTKGQKKAEKRTARPAVSTDNEKPIWSFEGIDKIGMFRFDIERPDFDSKTLLNWMIDINGLTWIQIKQQTHDRNDKSCNHYLDYDGMSREAKERVLQMIADEDMDKVFSMRVNNKRRIIGIRDGAVFRVKWFDPEHQFYPADR